MKNRTRKSKRGSALVLVLVTLIILSSVMVSFLYRLHLESDLIIAYRFRMKASSLAGAGQEYAKLMLIKSARPGTEPEEEYGEAMFVATRNLSRGMRVEAYTLELEQGTVTIYIAPEAARRNVNDLPEPDWEQMLENTGVPDELHSELFSAFRDWVDADEAARLKGAESDDPYYQDNEIVVKNARVDTLDEMLLIKGFTPAILYGGTLEEEYDMPDVQVTGIAPLLTTYGGDTINLNAASREVLQTVSGLGEEEIDRIIEGRMGLDDTPGTEDDGYQNTGQALSYAGLPGDLSSLFSTDTRQYIRVTSIGEAGGVQVATWAIYEFNGSSVTTLTYREEGL